MATIPETSGIALNEILRNALDGMFVIDRDRRFVLFSDGCERITGYDRASVLGMQCHCHDLTECHDAQGRSLAGALCPSLQVFRGDLPAARQRMSIKHRDGREIWVETTYSPMRDERGAVVCVVGVLSEITDARRSTEPFSSDQATGWSPSELEAVPLADSDTGSNGRHAEVETGNRPLDDVLTTIEKREIMAALRRANGQRTQAAQLLKISRSRLYRRMEALGIDPRTLGPGGSI